MKSRFLAGMLLFIFMVTSLILGDEILILRAQDKPGWEAEWERTVAAARKEGQLKPGCGFGECAGHEANH